MKKVIYFISIFLLMTLSVTAKSKDKIGVKVTSKTNGYFENAESIAMQAKKRLQANISKFANEEIILLNNDDTLDVINTQREQESYSYNQSTTVAFGEFVGAQKTIYLTVNSLENNYYDISIDITNLEEKTMITHQSRRVTGLEDLLYVQGCAVDDVSLQLFDTLGIKLKYSEKKMLQFDKKAAARYEEEQNFIEEQKRKDEEYRLKTERLEAQRKREEEEAYRKRLEKERKDEEKRIAKENLKDFAWGRHNLISTNFGGLSDGMKGFDFDLDLSLSLVPCIFIGYNLDVILPETSLYYRVIPDKSFLMSHNFKIGCNLDCYIFDISFDIGFGFNVFEQVSSVRCNDKVKFNDPYDYYMDESSLVDPTLAYNLGIVIPFQVFGLSCNYTKTIILDGNEKKGEKLNPKNCYSAFNVGIGIVL